MNTKWAVTPLLNKPSIFHTSCLSVWPNTCCVTWLVLRCSKTFFFHFLYELSHCFQVTYFLSYQLSLNSDHVRRCLPPLTRYWYELLIQGCQFRVLWMGGGYLYPPYLRNIGLPWYLWFQMHWAWLTFLPYNFHHKKGIHWHFWWIFGNFY